MIRGGTIAEWLRHWHEDQKVVDSNPASPTRLTQPCTPQMAGEK